MADNKGKYRTEIQQVRGFATSLCLRQLPRDAMEYGEREGFILRSV